MADNNTQPSRSTSEVFEMSVENDLDMQSLLLANDNTTDQPPTIHFNATDMIPPTTLSDDQARDDPVTVTGPLLAEPQLPETDIEVLQRESRRRLEASQQRLDQERRNLAQMQSNLDHEQNHLNRERNSLNIGRTGDGRHQRQRQRQRRDTGIPRLLWNRRQRRQQNQSSRRDRQPRHYHYPRMIYNSRNPDPYQETDDDDYSEPLLDTYNYENLSTRERREAWEQEHLLEMEGLSGSESVQTLVLEQEEQQFLDEIRQDTAIRDMLWDEQQDRYHRNQEHLADKEEWDDLAFRLQQQP